MEKPQPRPARQLHRPHGKIYVSPHGAEAAHLGLAHVAELEVPAPKTTQLKAHMSKRDTSRLKGRGLPKSRLHRSHRVVAPQRERKRGLSVTESVLLVVCCLSFHWLMN